MDCYGLFFNSLVSQLFLASITNLLELIQLIFIGFFKNNLIDNDFFRRHCYIKPLLASVIFGFCGIGIYFFHNIILLPMLAFFCIVIAFVLFKKGPVC